MPVFDSITCCATAKQRNSQTKDRKNCSENRMHGYTSLSFGLNAVEFGAFNEVLSGALTGNRVVVLLPVMSLINH